MAIASRRPIRTIQAPSPRASSISTGSSTRAPASTAARPSARCGSTTAPCCNPPPAGRGFGEGIVNWGNQIISITWQNGIGYRWDRADLRRHRRVPLSRRRLGPHPGRHAHHHERRHADLRFLDPATLREVRRIEVTVGGRPVDRSERARIGPRRDLRQCLADRPDRADRPRHRPGEGLDRPRALVAGIPAGRTTTSSTASPTTRRATGCSSPARTGRSCSRSSSARRSSRRRRSKKPRPGRRRPPIPKIRL